MWQVRQPKRIWMNIIPCTVSSGQNNNRSNSHEPLFNLLNGVDLLWGATLTLKLFSVFNDLYNIFL